MLHLQAHTYLIRSCNSESVLQFTQRQAQRSAVALLTLICHSPPCDLPTATMHQQTDFAMRRLPNPGQQQDHIKDTRLLLDQQQVNTCCPRLPWMSLYSHLSHLIVLVSLSSHWSHRLISFISASHLIVISHE